MTGQGTIRGIYTPFMVPLEESGAIDEAELCRYVDWLVRRGVHGLYPNGSTSEFIRFTAQERRRIVERTVEATAGRVPILAGAAEANVHETLTACEAYAGMGVRAVAIVAPFYYRLSPDNVYAYFYEIGRHSPVDVTLYNIPMFASPIDLTTIRRLSEACPRIVGIKDSSGDVAAMMRMIEAVRPNRPDFSFLTGWEAVLVPMLLVGCDGGTHASSGFVPELTRKIFDLCAAGRWTEAAAVQYRLRRLFDEALLSVDFPEGFREAVSLRGFRMGRSRQPLSEEHRTKLATLRRRLAAVFAEEGFATEEAGKEKAPLAADAGQLTRVVETVLSVLHGRGAM